MKLTDLEPRWIHPNVFVFLCPHCREWLLVCKSIETTHKQQRIILEGEFGEDWNQFVVMAKDDFAWSISGTRPSDPNAAFPNDLSVSPSIDASAAGHWHGSITNGEIK